MPWNTRTQAIVLAAGILLWGAVFYWRATQPAPAPAQVRGQATAGARSGARAAARPAGEAKSGAGREAPAKAAPAPTLRLDLLEQPLPPLKPEARNLFASVLPPPPPPPQPAPAAAAPPPPDPFLEEARKLRLVAIMQEDGQNVAFIEDGKEVHSVKKNDVIRSRFLIKDVSEDGAVVSMPNGEKEVRLALSPSAEGGQK